MSGWRGKLSAMSGPDPKANLHDYLRGARAALVGKLDGLTEYDLRRPLTPTATNLLGLVKHLIGVEVDYFGDTFGRPAEKLLFWAPDETEPNIDMWATPDESSSEIIEGYRKAWAHADATIEALDLTATGRVPHWPADRNEVTLHQILVHVLAETNRHAGHADIVRELIDGVVGLRADNDNMTPGDQAWWADYRDRVEQDAREAGRHQT
jgi:hypothetical protein